MNNKRVKTILDQNNIEDRDLERIDYHMGILNSSVEGLIKRLKNEEMIPEIEKMSELELAKLLAELIRACDIGSEKYNRELDVIMTEFGRKYRR